MALLPLVTFLLAPVTCYVLQKLIEPAIYINSVCVVKAVGCGADEENPARDGFGSEAAEKPLQAWRWRATRARATRHTRANAPLAASSEAGPPP